MDGTMQAARLHKPGERYEIEDVPIPDIQANEVLVKILQGPTGVISTSVTAAGSTGVKRATCFRIYQ